MECRGSDQRYNNSKAGRFFSPDPSGMSTVDMQNPISSNMYAYANGASVNSNNPDGLDCASTPYCFNGVYQGTIGDIIAKQSDIHSGERDVHRMRSRVKGGRGR